MIRVDSNEVLFHLVQKSTSIHVREPSTNALYDADQLFTNTDENDPTAANNSNNLSWPQQRSNNKLCVLFGLSVVEFEYIDLHRKSLQLILLCKCVIHVLVKKGKCEPILVCIK